MLNLFCLVFGESAEFSVQIGTSNNETVDNLKMAIKETMQIPLPHYKTSLYLALIDISKNQWLTEQDSDFADLIDGMLWYRSDLDKFRALVAKYDRDRTQAPQIARTAPE